MKHQHAACLSTYSRIEYNYQQNVICKMQYLLRGHCYEAISNQIKLKRKYSQHICVVVCAFVGGAVSTIRSCQNSMSTLHPAPVIVPLALEQKSVNWKRKSGIEWCICNWRAMLSYTKDGMEWWKAPAKVHYNNRKFNFNVIRKRDFVHSKIYIALLFYENKCRWNPAYTNGGNMNATNDARVSHIQYPYSAHQWYWNEIFSLAQVVFLPLTCHWYPLATSRARALNNL